MLRILYVAALGLIIATISPSRMYAISYGSGPYGTCAYSSDCGPSTIVTVPPAAGSTASGLEVNINLSNGQVIPRSGYTILVTPLNGRGSSFQEVQFYINGSLVQSQAPAEDGTVAWFWNTAEFPGTIIKVVVIGSAGQAVTQTFQVRIAGASTTNPAAIQSFLQQIVSTPGKVVHALSRAVGRLPKSVKYGLPYFLFVLLGGDVALLLYRARHEIVASKRVKALLARERENAELKHTFTQLVSHYLRTPITVIKGGLDFATYNQTVVPQEITLASTSVDQLNTAVNELVSQLSTQHAKVIVSSQEVKTTKATASRWWLAPLLPIGLVGVVSFLFDYLVHHSQGFSLSQVNTIIQIVVFGSLSLLAFQIIRRSQLVRRDNLKTAHLLEVETAFNTERDQVIAYGATQIRGFVDKLVTQTQRIQVSGEPKKLIDDGIERLQQVVEKMIIANQLKGSHSMRPYVSVSLKDLVQNATVGLEPQIAAKSIQVATINDATLQTRSKELLVTVLHTLLDNAIAYSEQGGLVEISAKLQNAAAAISVIDHGSGIPSAKKFSLFQAFSKTEGAETFNHEGMGFSLYLDKLIMNYLVGSIDVESTPKQGTTVLLTLPQPLEG